MGRHRLHVTWAFASAIVLAVLADVAVDSLVRARGGSDGLAGGMFRIAPSTNDGIAFGLLQGTGALPILAAGGAVALIVTFAIRQRHPIPMQFALGLLVGGAIANLLERFAYGSVLDYVDVGLGSLRWPTFNMGDVSISIALLIIAAQSLRTSDDGRDAAPSKPDATDT